MLCSLPRINDSIDKLAGKKYYIAMNLASRYWQIELEKNSKKKTAFISSTGLWKFNVMPFGLCNAPVTFQRLMDNILRDPEWEAGRDYIDVIIGSSTFDNHIRYKTNMFQELQKAKLKVELNKYLFEKKKVIYLEHEISTERVRPNPAKIKAINKMQLPIDIYELRSFLGLTSYYWKFVEKYAYAAKLLNQLQEKERYINRKKIANMLSKNWRKDW